MDLCWQSCQETKIHLNASSVLCLFIPSEQGTKNHKLTKAWRNQIFHYTHVCWITELFYFHSPQNVLEWPQVSQKDSSYRLLMRVWTLSGWLLCPTLRSPELILSSSWHSREVWWVPKGFSVQFLGVILRAKARGWALNTVSLAWQWSMQRNRGKQQNGKD